MKYFISTNSKVKNFNQEHTVNNVAANQKIGFAILPLIVLIQMSKF